MAKLNEDGELAFLDMVVYVEGEKNLLQVVPNTRSRNNSELP